MRKIESEAGTRGPRAALNDVARRLAGALAAAVLVGGGVAAAQMPQRKQTTPQELIEKARTEGLRGRVHGANPRLGAYVFTWWRPGDFFDSVNFSLVPANPEAGKAIAGLERHQAVLVRGRIETGYGSQPHLLVESLEPGEKWSPGVRATPTERIADLEKALAGKTRLSALVHAVSEDGGMLVVEWRDEVVPVQVPSVPQLRQRVRELFRGDRVRFGFRIAAHPRRPLHLTLDSGAGSPPRLEVTDSIHAQHDRERTVEGRLVLFPHSPVLRRSIWAVEDPGPDGLHRYFTIFNFEDLKDQDRTDAKLDAAWRAKPDGVLDARNKYIHTGVRVRVTGKVSNPAQNQANPTLRTTSERVEIVADGQ